MTDFSLKDENPMVEDKKEGCCCIQENEDVICSGRNVRKPMKTEILQHKEQTSGIQKRGNQGKPALTTTIRNTEEEPGVSNRRVDLENKDQTI